MLAKYASRALLPAARATRICSGRSRHLHLSMSVEQTGAGNDATQIAFGCENPSCSPTSS